MLKNQNPSADESRAFSPAFRDMGEDARNRVSAEIESEVSVDLWFWNNADETDRSAVLFKSLNEMELARRDRHFSPEKGRHWAISRAQVREHLAVITGSDPRALEFEENDFGRPCLVGSDLSFSVSHDGSWTVLAVSRDASVGVDIESIQHLDREEMDWPLSPRERADLARVAPSDRHQAFFRYWTLKEAFIKALGLGVSFPLEDFDMSAFGAKPAVLRVAGAPEAVENWDFKARQIKPDLWFALAVNSCGRTPKITYHAKNWN
nr:4'-phosphopantetheinyl transferase superfamily protein [Hyphomonas sp. Mor2]